MFRQYLSNAIRNFSFRRGRRNARYAYINLVGLLIGLTSFLIIAQYVVFEYSYDKHIPEGENLYRVKVKKVENEQVTLETVKAYPGVGPLMKNNLPQVLQYARVLKEECMLHEKERDIKFNRQITFWADKQWVGFLGLKLVEKGDTTLLDKPWAALISATAAKRFYGDRSPIGKTLYLNETLGFTIQGVFEDIPSNTHLEADFIVSYATLVLLVGPGFENGMPPFYNATYTYVKLQPGTDVTRTEQEAQQLLSANIPASAMNDVRYEFSLQPVHSIHLQSRYTDELKPNGNETFVHALAVAALIILVVAWINFISLATVRAFDRAREVGVLKCLGSTRRQLAAQFTVESLVTSLIAAVLAVGIVYLASDLVSTEWGVPLARLDAFPIGSVFPVIVLIGGVLSGLYPAFVLSSFKPVEVLKGKTTGGAGHGIFRKVLLGVQFFFALCLLSATAVVYYQVDYMRKQDLGMDTDQVLVLHSPRSMIGNEKRASIFATFRERIHQNPGIVSVGSSACMPGEEFLIHQDGVRSANEDNGANVTFDMAWVDEGYLPTLGMPLISGRNFLLTESEGDKVIINEQASQDLGFGNPSSALQALVTWRNRTYQIIGVVKDAHYEGLQKRIRPVILFYGHNYEFGFFSMKTQTSDIGSLLQTVERHWIEIYPNDPFDYFFLDSFFDRQYKGDVAFGRMFGAFAFVAIAIALMGLISLVSFTTFRRTQEIGIRKVLGATVVSIHRLLGGEFMKPILLASGVAISFMLYLSNAWLETFAFHFQLTGWLLLIPAFVLLLLALTVVVVQSGVAASRNPVDSLREQG